MNTFGLAGLILHADTQALFQLLAPCLHQGIETGNEERAHQQGRKHATQYRDAQRALTESARAAGEIGRASCRERV